LVLVRLARVLIPVAVRFPPIYVSPATMSLEFGVVVPMPTFPAPVIVKSEEPVEDATTKEFSPAMP